MNKRPIDCNCDVVYGGGGQWGVRFIDGIVWCGSETHAWRLAEKFNAKQVEIERLLAENTLLRSTPTWLCGECRDQWLMRDAGLKEVSGE